MTLSRLLLINAVATFAAGVVLFINGDLISGAVGIHIAPSAYFIFYLLGASEFGFATLCWSARHLTDPQAARMVATTCIVFHAASGVAGVLAYAQGVSAGVWWNVLLRVIMVGLFVRLGLVRRV